MPPLFAGLGWSLRGVHCDWCVDRRRLRLQFGARVAASAGGFAVANRVTAEGASKELGCELRNPCRKTA